MQRWKENENRKYLRAGTIAAAALNPYRSKDHPDPFTAFDFFNIPRPPRPRLTKEQLIARAESFFSWHNSNVVKLEGRKKKRSA